MCLHTTEDAKQNKPNENSEKKKQYANAVNADAESDTFKKRRNREDITPVRSGSHARETEKEKKI